jgi:DNA-binding NarL/FixJ family response regulator
MNGRELPRVLLADRHPPFRRGLSETLHVACAASVIAETDDGAEAMALSQHLRPQVVFLDLSLRNLSGLELARRLTAQTAAPKIIVLSAQCEQGFVRLALQAGAHGYLSKEATMDQVLDALGTVLRGKRYIEPKIQKRPELSCSRRLGAAKCVLSPREEQVLRLLSCGSSTRDVAEAVKISDRTVETYRMRAMSKLALSGRVDLVRFAVVSGWLEHLG